MLVSAFSSRPAVTLVFIKQNAHRDLGWLVSFIDFKTLRLAAFLAEVL